MINDSIVKLVERLSGDCGVSKNDAMKDVMRKESYLHSERFLNEGKVGLSTSYFYSAIGRVRKEYKLKDFEDNMVRDIYRKYYIEW